MPSSTNISVLIELPNCNLLIRIGSTRSIVLFQFNPFQCSSHFRFVGLDFGLLTIYFFLQNCTSDVSILREPCTATYLCQVRSWRRQFSVHTDFLVSNLEFGPLHSKLFLRHVGAIAVRNLHCKFFLEYGLHGKA